MRRGSISKGCLELTARYCHDEACLTRFLRMTSSKESNRTHDLPILYMDLKSFSYGLVGREAAEC